MVKRTCSYNNRDLKDKYIGLRNRYFKIVTEKNKLKRKVMELKDENEQLKKQLGIE